MNNTLKWVAGVWSILWAIMCITQLHIVSFILFSIAACMILPPMIRKMEAQNRQTNPDSSYWTTFFVFFLPGIFFAPKDEKQTQQMPSAPQMEVQSLQPLSTPSPVVNEPEKIDSTLKANGIPLEEPKPIVKPIKKKVPKKVKEPDVPDGYIGNGYIRSSRSTSRSGYIRGPKGGCYYINSNGKKVYVDRSLCD